ncbi:MAG: DUF3300 domain-containing protein [Burkholderiales bacterium]
MKSLVNRLLRGLVVAIAFALPIAAGAQSSGKPFTNEQLDQMTAQIALYPDSLLAQLFMATTYPEDFAAAAAWSKAHPDAKGDDAVKMVENQPWDPSVASMVAFPEVVITLGEKPDWVKNMGDAFLAQPDDVMDSVQRLRQRAQQAGNLSSNQQIKVSTQAVEPAPAPATSTTTVVQQAAPPPQVIVIEPAQPSVVYVPAYNPAVVYGTWPYPAYPPYYYPPPPGYWFSRTIATGIAWGVGIGISNALWGGCNWGRHDVDINVNRYNNINVNKRIDVNSNRTSWNHNPERRGSAPYRGGNDQRQKLDNKYQAGNREQYRGKDASRDASRDRASQAMQSRGVDTGGGSARDRAQSVDRDAARQKPQGTDRSATRSADSSAAREKAQSATRSADAGAAREKAQSADRSAARSADSSAAREKAQSADRDAARQRAQSASRDNALKGANSPQARQQVDRGAASQKVSQQRASGGGGGARPSGGGGGGRAGGGRRG